MSSVAPLLVFTTRGSAHASSILDAPKLHGLRGPTRRCAWLSLALISLFAIIFFCRVGRLETTSRPLSAHANLTDADSAPMMRMPESAALFEKAMHEPSEGGDDEDGALRRVNPRWNSGAYAESAVVIDLARTVGWLVHKVNHQR